MRRDQDIWGFFYFVLACRRWFGDEAHRDGKVGNAFWAGIIPSFCSDKKFPSAQDDTQAAAAMGLGLDLWSLRIAHVRVVNL
jgi:hypothetical protein